MGCRVRGMLGPCRMWMPGGGRISCGGTWEQEEGRSCDGMWVGGGRSPGGKQEPEGRWICGGMWGQRDAGAVMGYRMLQPCRMWMPEGARTRCGGMWEHRGCTGICEGTGVWDLGPRGRRDPWQDVGSEGCGSPGRVKGLPSPFPRLEAAALRHSEKRLMLPACGELTTAAPRAPLGFSISHPPRSTPGIFPSPAPLLTQPWGQTGRPTNLHPQPAATLVN